jgi:hypothetical protein
MQKEPSTTWDGITPFATNWMVLLEKIFLIHTPFLLHFFPHFFHEKVHSDLPPSQVIQNHLISSQGLSLFPCSDFTQTIHAYPHNCENLRAVNE